MFQIADRYIGDGSPCFITYEAGPTHDGLESAKELVRLAADAGADAVKFQIFDPDRLVEDKALPFSYEVLVDRETGETETVTEPLFDILSRRCLREKDWREVRATCTEAGVAFFATVGFEEDIRLLESLECDSVKIASADINHLPLISMAAKTGMCVQLDTGNATLGEVEVAVDTILAQGNERIIIHQCPSGYPAHLESINLRLIKTLKQLFPFPVAFSDHSPGRDMDVAALAMGVNLLEKTITKDRLTRSVEHIFSLEPLEMAGFVKSIRDVELAMGTSRRLMGPQERQSRKAVRRSMFAKKDIAVGDEVSVDTVEFRRPGFGIGPDRFIQLEGKRFVSPISKGSMISQSDIGEE